MSKSNVIIKIVNDDYTNDSSIPNMINYIYRTKNCKSKQTEALPIHAYGILTVPPTYTSLINDFQAVYISANPENSSRHIWHVIFSYNRSKISKKSAIVLMSLPDRSDLFIRLAMLIILTVTIYTAIW